MYMYTGAAWRRAREIAYFKGSGGGRTHSAREKKRRQRERERVCVWANLKQFFTKPLWIVGAFGWRHWNILFYLSLSFSCALDWDLLFYLSLSFSCALDWDLAQKKWHSQCNRQYMSAFSVTPIFHLLTSESLLSASEIFSKIYLTLGPPDWTFFSKPKTFEILSISGTWVSAFLPDFRISILKFRDQRVLFLHHSLVLFRSLSFTCSFSLSLSLPLCLSHL